jgi:hypothetical protein
MLETHFQQITSHLSTGMAESFTGGKVETAYKPEAGIHSPYGGIIKTNLSKNT